jgi:putative ABC transport system permease protein
MTLLNLGMRKLRTALAMLGMIFGVAAVLAMLSIGAGAEQKALSVIEEMGLRNIIVRAKDFAIEELRILRQDSPGLSLRDARALGKVLPQETVIVGKRELETYQVASAIGKADSQVLGVNAAYPEVANLNLVEGRFFLPIDETLMHQVCVLGTSARRKLLGLDKAVGRHIKLNEEWFVVVGVLADSQVANEEVEGVKLDNPSNKIYIPLQTALNKFERDPAENELDEIVVHIVGGSDLWEQAALVSGMIASTHNNVDDFSLVVPERLHQQTRQTQAIFNVVMGAIASISLVVGGIGIMNIMLASVLERTTEIGLRRAVGARRRDISVQFVLESVMIGVTGALFGITVGYGMANLVSAYSGWSTIVTPASVLLSVGVSVSVGLVFGIYPARKAARVSPIEALRYE